MALHPFVIEVLHSLWLIVKAPLSRPELLWQLAPVILMWGVMEVYFGLHKKEELGWNTALGNGISLFWIIISAMQFIFNNKEHVFSWDRFYVILFITIYAIFLIYISFRHSFSAKFTYVMGAPTMIYFFSYIALIYAFGLIDASLPMITAIALLLGLVIGSETIFKALLPNEDNSDDTKDDFDFSKDDTKDNLDFDLDAKTNDDPFGSATNNNSIDSFDNNSVKDPFGSTPNRNPTNNTFNNTSNNSQTNTFTNNMGQNSQGQNSSFRNQTPQNLNQQQYTNRNNIRGQNNSNYDDEFSY